MRFTGANEPDAANTVIRRFIVVIHDVCPAHSSEVKDLVAALEPLVGQTICAAVVPNWHDLLFTPELGFAKWLTCQFGEILLHGWTHHRKRGGGLISYCTNQSDEFNGLTRDETSSRLALGQNQVKTLFGFRSAGFIPPAWQAGPLDRSLMRQAGLQFLLGYTALEFVDCKRIPLSTVTWDVGRFARLAGVAENVGHILGRLPGRGLRCLAAHPIDVSRGFLPRIVRTVKSWIESGRMPILPSELLSATQKDIAS